MKFFVILSFFIVQTSSQSPVSDVRGVRCIRKDTENSVWIDFFGKGECIYKINFGSKSEIAKEKKPSIRSISLKKGYDLPKWTLDVLQRNSNVVTWANLVNFPERKEQVIYVTRSPHNSDKWPLTDTYNATFINGTSVDERLITPESRTANNFFFAVHVLDFKCNYRMYHYGYYLYWFKYRIYVYNWPGSTGWVRLGGWYDVMDNNPYRIPKFILTRDIDDHTIDTAEKALIIYSDDTIIFGNARKAIRLEPIEGPRYKIPAESGDILSVLDSPINYSPTLVGG